MDQLFSCDVNTLFLWFQISQLPFWRDILDRAPQNKKLFFSSLVWLSSSRAWVADPMAGRDNRDQRNWNRDDRDRYNPHNPYEVRMPRYQEPISVNDDHPEDTSVIVVDNRDERMISPFQNWLVSEIMTNSASSINVITERDQVMPPSSGFHLSLFANYTLDGVKAVLVVSIESDTGVPCAGWDGPTAHALSHPVFQPFSWPMLRDTSASYIDVKIYNGNELLFHWIFRGYRTDTDLTVQQQFVDEVLIRTANVGTPKLSCVVAMFQGWRVSVLAFQCGGRTYSAAPNGNVVAGDFARSRWELRVCSRSSEDAVGNDADRIEFRFRDANNRIDVKAARASVPATWLTVSHISGPNLVTTIQAVRRGGARVEGPEQTEQFGQLAAIHQNWWANSVAGLPTEVGAKVVFIGALDAGNFHIQSSSRFYPQIAEIVPTESLATMHHDRSVAIAAPQGPPALTSQAWLQASQDRQGERDQAGEDETRIQNRAGRELDTRALNRVTVANAHEGVRGHVVDQGRDEARQDRSYTRSSANITPAVFADQLGRRRFNETTARVEEIPEEEAQPKPKSNFPPATSAPINVTVQAPADTAQGTPASAGPPQSFGPAGGSKEAQC